VKKRPSILRKMSLGVAGEGSVSGWRELGEGAEADGFVGVDGSMNIALFKSHALYAVTAESVLGEGEEVRVLDQLSDVDVVIPYHNVEERVRAYMNIAELRLALKALRRYPECTVVLDGSLTSMVIRPWKYRFSESAVENVFRKYQDELVQSVYDDLVLYSKKAAEANLAENGFPEEEILLLEYIEYLTLLYTMLYEYPHRVISIAKRTEAHRITPFLPDAAVYDAFTITPGYTIDDQTTLASHKNRTFLYWDFFKKLSFTVVYARLGRGTSVLRLETLNPDVVPRVLRGLRKYSVGGYPYFMVKAHRDVTISNRDMETVIRILGLYNMKNGREVLLE